MEISTAGALAWRLRRHFLLGAGAGSVAEVAERLVATRGWPVDALELSFAVRLAGTGDPGDAGDPETVPCLRDPRPGGVTEALDEGSLVRSYAFRGGSYVFTHQLAAIVLAVRASSRLWESDRYQRQAGFSLTDWSPLREAVRGLLTEGPKTREEISARLAATPGLRELAPAALGAGADTLYKPLHWWGDICFGPVREGRTTFRLLAGDPRWPGLPDADEAGRLALRAYLASYAPATPANLRYWLVESLGVPGRQLDSWIASLADETATVRMDGVEALALRSDVEAIASALPTDSVNLIPAHDPWILNPGTADPHLIDPARRAFASHGNNLILRSGRVAGTWRRAAGSPQLDWFPKSVAGDGS